MASNALSAPGRKSGNRRALLLSVVFGAVSAVLVVVYLGSREGSGGGSAVTVPAVFAVRDIPERTTIKEGMVEVREIPIDARHNLALQDEAKAVGQITRVRIAAGEQVLSNKLAEQVKAVGFAANVPEGKRAIAVGVTEVIGTGGNIAPGDFVDVIGVFEVNTTTSPRDTAAKDQGDKPKVFTAITILQNIQVLAVARDSEDRLESGNDSKKQPKAADIKSVTLAVTPEQAEKLFLAEEIGRLRLSLRPFGESEERKVAPVSNSLEELLRP
jgi:pilus assembly protein CpaB